MALQWAGDDDPGRAFALAERWSADLDPLVRRAAVAAVCEPRLLRDSLFARRALAMLERVTADLAPFDLLSASDGADVAWVVRENRKKVRLKRLLADRD